MNAHRTWKYVTLDATGTLLRPAEPPGVTYLRFWEATSGQSFSSSRRAALGAALTSNFPSEFSLQSRRRPNFGSDGTTASAFPWWRELILNVMTRSDVAVNAELSERFTRDLYAHFARPEAWTVYDDVRPTLEKLRTLNVPMGVISNFDERLEPLLADLELRSFFDVVTTSFSQPHMKPHTSIFLSTFKQMQREEGDVEPSRFLHVGDHLSKDYKAAKDVGAHARLVWRNKQTAPPPNVVTELRRDFDGMCVSIASELAVCDDPTRWLDLLTAVVVEDRAPELTERLEMDFLPQIVQILLGKSLESGVERVHKFLQWTLENVKKGLKQGDVSRLSCLARILDGHRRFYLYHGTSNDTSETETREISDQTRRFIVRRSSEYTSRYFLHNLEYWGQLDGFSVLLDVLQTDTSFEVLQCVLRTLYDVKDHLNSEFLGVYFPKLTNSVCTFMQHLPSADFYALSRDSLLEVVQVMELLLVKIEHGAKQPTAMTEHVSLREICEQRVQILRLEISMRFFQSTSLEKRIYGLTEIVVIITRLYNDQIQEQTDPTAASLLATLDYLVNWMHDKRLMQELLGEKMHVELIKRSTSLFQFVSELEVLPTEWIDLVWSCYHAEADDAQESRPVQRRHEAFRSTIHDLLLEMATFMENPSLLHLVRRIESVKAKLDSNQLGLLAAIAARRFLAFEDARTSLRQRILMHLWSTVLPYVRSEDFQDEILLRMHEILRLEATSEDETEVKCKCAMLDEFLGLCMDNIRRRENLGISLKLFTQLSALAVEVGIIVAESSDAYVGVLLSETVDYKERIRQNLNMVDFLHLMDDAREKLSILTNHVGEVKNRLLALRAAWILDAADDNESSFTEEQLNKVWELMIADAFLSDEAALCFQWIELCLNTPVEKNPIIKNADSRALMPLSIAEYLLTTKFATLSNDHITLSTLCCFHSIFRRINNLKGGDKEESVELMTGQPLVGLDELWQLAVRATDAAVAEEIIALLASFHLAFTPEIRQTELPFQCKMRFIEKCMGFIATAKKGAELVSDADNDKKSKDVAIVNRCVDLLRYFLEACKVEDDAASKDEEDLLRKLESEAAREENQKAPKIFPLEHLEERLPYLEMYPSPMKDSQSEAAKIGYPTGRRPSWTFRQQHALLDVIVDANEEAEVEESASTEADNLPPKIDILLKTESPAKPSLRSSCARADLSYPQASSPQRGPNLRPEDVDLAITDFTNKTPSDSTTKSTTIKTTYGAVSQILANQGSYFNVLLQLVDWNETTSQRTWDLLCRLPTNNELLRRMIHLRRAENEEADWSDLLDSSNIHRLLYALRLVEALLIPIEATNKDELNSGRRQWRERFVRLGGTKHLYETLLQWPEEQIFDRDSVSSQYAQNIRATCLAAVMRVLNYFFYWNRQTIERGHASPFDVRLQFSTFPEFVKSIELSSMLRVVVQLTARFSSQKSESKAPFSDEAAEAVCCGVQLCCSIIRFEPHLTSQVFNPNIEDGKSSEMSAWLKSLLVDCPSKSTRGQALLTLSEMATAFGFMDSSSTRSIFELLVGSACYLVSDECFSEKIYNFSVLEELFTFCRVLLGYSRVLETINLAGRQWNYAPADSFLDVNTPHVGLVNPGCICYMNSLVQQLFMMPKFSEGLLALDFPQIISDQKSPWQEEVEQLQRLFVSLAYTNRRSCDPVAFARSHKDMDGNATDVHIQMDADEFFSLLLDRLEMFIRPKSMDSSEAKTEDFMAHCFGGVLVNQILTQQGNLSEREEKFFALSVEVSKKRHLSESLELYVQGETLEGENAYFCEREQRKVSATKRVCIKKLPQTLVCHLKRFEFDYDTMEKMKINDYLEFPMEIDMFPYTSDAGADSGDGKSIMYDLVGVVVHSGTSDTGHYYSFIKDREATENPRWLEFNDEIIREFDVETMGEECFGGEEVAQKWNAIQGTYSPLVHMKRRSAYMLIYERRSEEILSVDSEKSTVSSQVQILADQIMQVNARYEGVVNAFAPNYEQFISDLVDSATRSECSPEVARKACQIGYQFVFGIGSLRCRTTDSSSASSSSVFSRKISARVVLYLAGYGKSPSSDDDDERVNLSKWILTETVAPPNNSLSNSAALERQRTWLFDTLFLTFEGQELADCCFQILLAAVRVLTCEMTKAPEADESLVDFLQESMNLLYSREPHLDVSDPVSGCVLTLSMDARMTATKQLGAFFDKCIGESSENPTLICRLFLEKLQFFNHFLLSLQTPVTPSDVIASSSVSSRGIAPLAIETRSATPVREHDLRVAIFYLEMKLLRKMLEAYESESLSMDTTPLFNHAALKNTVLFGLEDIIQPLLTRVMFESENPKCDRLVSLLVGVLEEVKDTHADKVLAVFARLLDEEEERSKSFEEDKWTLHRHVFSPTRGILESVTYYRDHGSREYTHLLLEFVVRRASTSSTLRELFKRDAKISNSVSWIPQWLLLE
ncbi:ubiquitin-specific protease, putative [Phytophthora infestans T30-4]|uniref:ubiquitinyl hydrolase 1 n=1 Tax=Phytophthora infestans (strain T30-4) TaxID=403677 RepID=D0NWA3_PHYIT|nr:ubiquitin-specific protease, putative [Phytophthora infestans T30-4]EEY66920.1 ubiquitin-specific protease, putative [Phytophthora infestans T30-4]|eukprot:XP_002896638.1 ubiquitin-specific protease, putative [Phytophthora infestans T30-4]